MELFRAEAFFLLLSNFTGLKLHFLAPEDEDEEGGEMATGDSSSKSTQKNRVEETNNGDHTVEHEKISESEDSKSGTWSLQTKPPSGNFST